MTSAALAVEYHVTPEGTDRGAGTVRNPMSLSVALSTRSPAHPGDTIWLHAGTYSGPFTSTLTGNPDNPIIVRQFPGERATIDCTATNGSALTINGAWTWYWGFEVMNSSTDRASARCTGVNIYGANTKCINLVVHDCGVGIGSWSTATNSEIYGCLIYNNGWQGPGKDRGHGHGIYTQNERGTKLLRDNIIFNQFGYGVHIYTEKGAIQGFDLEGNIAFNNGTLTRGTNHYDNYLVGGSTPADRIALRQNFGYHTPHHGGGNLELGFHAMNNTVTIESNFFAGGSVAVKWWTNVTCLDNTFALFDGTVALRSIPGAAAYFWDRNRYYFRFPWPVSEDGTNITFTRWQTDFGYDRTGLLTTNDPTGVQVFVRRNAFESNRANIVVFNWDLRDNAQVELRNFLPLGTIFEIRNAQDFFGPPVVTSRFTGEPISVPMTNLTLVKGIGVQGNSEATWPRFNVFVMKGLKENWTTGLQDHGPQDRGPEPGAR